VYLAYKKNLSKNNLAYDALHGMAYYIFLKSLRILEEFKKNPHIKIPPKSPCINFQSLEKFKNLIFILKRFSLWISAQQPAGLLGPFGPTGPAGFLLPPRAKQSRHRRHRPFATSPRLPSLACHGATSPSSALHPSTISPSSPLHSTD
jgi:hypothetical protein